MRNFRSTTLAVLSVQAGLWFSAVTIKAGEPAQIIAVQVVGTVGAGPVKSTRFAEVKEGARVTVGAAIVTAARSGVVLVLPNGSTMRLGADTRLVVTQVEQAPFTTPDLVVFGNLKPEPSLSHTQLELDFGELVVQVRKLLPESVFMLKTPAGLAGTSGAAFALAYSETEDGGADARLDVGHGLVWFTPAGGQTLDVTQHRRLEVRARTGRTGTQVQHVQTRILPSESVDRIERLNQVARENVNQVLQRARAMGSVTAPAEQQPSRPMPPAPPENTVKANRPAPPAKPERPPRPSGG